jgi:tetratricopeptide (TPR) repeat protein
MHRIALSLALGTVAACAIFGKKTTDEEKALNEFAEARQTAATYYDGGDFVRAAAQYEKALQLKPKNLSCKMGLAYSLMYANRPSTLTRADEEFRKMGRQRDPKMEVKRIYGLALTNRSLAVHFGHRAKARDKQGRIKLATDDATSARQYAREGITYFNKVMELDARLAEKQTIGPMRVSASLEPDAHIGIANCEILLIDPNLEAELRLRLASAEEHLEAYSKIVRNARKFWEKRRATTLVIDPLKDERAPGVRVMDPELIARYEERIANTIKHEVAVRQALMETLLFLNRFDDGIAQANKILDLDPNQDHILVLRAGAYARQRNFRAALRDLKAYRKRQDLGVLTDDLVSLNRRIQEYEREVAKQQDLDQG